MTELTNVIASKEAEQGFYPTPPALINKMLSMVSWDYVSSILEPSAGKGDLALAAAQKVHRNRYEEFNLSKIDLDCVEIDPYLRAILADKGFRVIHDDFLTYQTHKRYSLIIMNPPFADGAKHLLRANELLDDGGQMVCLLNAETLRNPCTNERDLLARMIQEANGKVEFIPNAFLDAERKTGVEIAMVSYKKPAAQKRSILMDGLRPGHKYVDLDDREEATLSKADFVDAIVDRYNYEVECGCALIREWSAMDKLLQADIGSDRAYCLNISLKVNNGSPSVNDYVKSVRRKYWSALFCAPQITSQFTTNLLNDFHKRVGDLENYEFSVYNIFEVMQRMNAQVSDGIEKTIMDLFDDWTRKYHWDENAQNRHYFDGWRTNDAFAVNKKVILPLRAYTDWGSRFDAEFKAYNVAGKLEDIEKVMNYLDGGRTAEGRSIRDILFEVEKTGETKKVDTKYFYITFYKKGTAHLEFKNMDLLAKFNIFAARGKNWLPPSFGRKRYAEMDSEEKRVVKSFLGDAKKYDAVVAHADYFLSSGSETVLALGA